MAEKESGNDAGLQAIAEGADNFANIFTKSVADSNHGNLISSPLSAQMVLAMAAYGAGGETATQMRSVLRIPSDNELGQSGYHSLIEALNTAKGVELRLANKIYTDSQFEVKPAYKELTATKFLSASEALDFGKRSAAANTINAWCEEQTNKRIKDVIEPDALNPDTKLVLVNAVYFKGNWVKQFDARSTMDRPFHVDEKTSKDVPTMFLKSRFRIGDLTELNARFIALPYQGHELSMIIILPNEVNGVKTVLDNLHRVNLSQTLKQTGLNQVELFLPKFKIECSFDLGKNLKKMGMTNMFTDEADFSGIAEERLKISKVVQKAFIEVNEKGSEAAAVTATMTLKCAMSYRVPPSTFKVDRPYYYAIYHDASAISLFTGIVEEPKLA